MTRRNRGETEDDGGSLGDHDNREDARYPTNDEVKVRIWPFQEVQAGKILNVSRSGLQLELATQVQIYANVAIEIITGGSVVVFGGIRYCHRSGAAFHSGVQIHDVIFGPREEHILEDTLSLYVLGRGLTAAEVLRINEHLKECAQCGSALAEVTEMLRRLGRLPPVP